jgi:hypothetical protein
MVFSPYLSSRCCFICCRALDIPGVSLSVPGYLVPISLPGVVSFVAPVYVYDLPP